MIVFLDRRNIIIGSVILAVVFSLGVIIGHYGNAHSEHPMSSRQRWFIFSAKFSVYWKVKSLLLLICKSKLRVSWVIKGWWHLGLLNGIGFGLSSMAVFSKSWDDLVGGKNVNSKAKFDTFYRFMLHHPLITQLNSECFVLLA